MRYVAITAAVFGASIFMVPGSHASDSGAATLPSIINPTSVPAVLTAKAEKPMQKNGQKAAVVKTAAATTTPTAPAPIVITVKPGDHLSGLAAANNMTAQRLYDANPSLENPDRIFPGNQLRVPTADEALTSRPLPVPAPVAAPQPVANQAAPKASAYSTPTPAAPPASAVTDGSIWDKLAMCESTGNWSINNGNGYYGGLQFTLASWAAVGGTGLPSDASREEQILRGQILQARGGWGNWPACTAMLGLR